MVSCLSLHRVFLFQTQSSVLPAPDGGVVCEELLPLDPGANPRNSYTINTLARHVFQVRNVWAVQANIKLIRFALC